MFEPIERKLQKIDLTTMNLIDYEKYRMSLSKYCYANGNFLNNAKDSPSSIISHRKIGFELLRNIFYFHFIVLSLVRMDQSTILENLRELHGNPAERIKACLKRMLPALETHHLHLSSHQISFFCERKHPFEGFESTGLVGLSDLDKSNCNQLVFRLHSDLPELGKLALELSYELLHSLVSPIDLIEDGMRSIDVRVAQSSFLSSAANKHEGIQEIVEAMDTIFKILLVVVHVDQMDIVLTMQSEYIQFLTYHRIK
jgi:hypothetical protein